MKVSKAAAFSGGNQNFKRSNKIYFSKGYRFNKNMAKDDFLNLIVKLTEAFKNSGKKDEKPAYKPENGSNGNPSFHGDFSSKSQNVVSPKQSVVEMLRRHEEISRKIESRKTE